MDAVTARTGLRRRGMLIAAVVLFLAGCKNSQKYDLIEAELRARNRELAEARAELEYYRGMSQVFQSHLARTADPAVPPGPVPVMPLKEISLGPGTGGASLGTPGADDSFNVVLVPLDHDGSAVKVPGRVVILAFEIADNGVKTQIGRWDIAPEMLRTKWRGGLLATGYYLQLQWDKPPTTGKIRVAARFTALDGRVYETDRDVSVRPLIGPSRIEELPPPAAGPVPAVRLGKVRVDS